MDKISVIVNGLTTPPFVVSCLQHIFRSTYRNLEVILLGNKSVEKCLLGYPEEQDRIQYIHTNTKSIAELKNIGFENSTGGYISFMHAKDLTGKMRYELQVPKIIENTKSGLIFCGTTFIDEDSKFQQGVNLWKKYNQQHFLAHMFQENRIPSISTTLIKRDVLEQVGVFDVQTEPMDEYDLWLRIGREFEVLYIDLPLVRFRVVENCQTTPNTRKIEQIVLQKHPPSLIAQHLLKLYDNEQEFRLALGKALERQGRNDDAYRSYMRALDLDDKNAESCFLIGNYFYEKHDFEEAGNWYTECLKRDPEHVGSQTNLHMLTSEARHTKYTRKVKNIVNLYRTRSLQKISSTAT